MSRIFEKGLLLLCSVFIVSACSNSSKITLKNKANIERLGVSIILSFQELESKCLALNNSSLLIVQDDDKNRIPIQYDDLDNDGKWDEIAFQQDFKPNEELVLTFINTDEKYTDNKEKAIKEDVVKCSNANIEIFIHHNFSEQLIKKEAVFRKVYLKGMSPFKAKRIEVTSGKLALQKNGEIFRMDSIENIEVISTGKYRTIVQVDYLPIIIDGATYALSEVIQLWEGKSYYDSEVKVKGVNLKDVYVVTVMGNISSDELKLQKPNSTSTFLYTYNEKYKIEYGLGVFFNDESFKGYGEFSSTANSYSNTYFAKFQPNLGDTLSLRYYIGLEKKFPFKSNKADSNFHKQRLLPSKSTIMVL
ncbi:DUF4861 family protein [Flammeovirga kamogawensis]|uniref:DUF4861 domain-containing protein n=1 Tax=Flammeovirga kamogawensis TaxID=373891 RepID=A0ABX8H584_9BACT|nr:DUF4861 family protein [Flammeovirga kamogawensis]MBB6461880.1 hypothetical protein [Flammeovirga kamogawensis]QWG10507.1 DUF4861 domain-containing protein [Flammeovirga kamogawensis]TRX63616.1 DUF4861 domain-containing protein [Flammeovirga kamogawensis]